MESVAPLKKRLGKMLKEKKVDDALEVIARLAELEPDDPVWPKRAARLWHAVKAPVSEVAAWRRALALQIAKGQVLDAIASCQSILEIIPADEEALECLDRLHGEGAPDETASGSATPRSAKDGVPTESAVPMKAGSTGAPHAEADPANESFTLTKLVPGARSIAMGSAEPGRVHEIPVDTFSSGHSGEIVDLHLDQWSTKSNLADLAAAQVASLPAAGDLERFQSGDSTNAASLRAELANVPLFGDLDPVSLHTLIHRVRVVHLDAGQTLFREGDAANSLYVAVEGAVTPIAEGVRRQKLAVLERGEFFGEIGVLTRQPRNATIEALVDTQLLAIDRRVLWDLIEKQPSVAKNILRFLRARLLDRQIRTNLFFAAFLHGEREAVARQFRVLEVADGTCLVEQGRPPDGLFVVLAGCLERYDRGNQKVVGEFVAGDVLGGLSLLEGRASALDVIAKGRCWLVLLGEARFRRIVDANPRLIRVLRRLARDSVKGAKLPSLPAL